MGTAYMAGITLYGAESKRNHDLASITRIKKDHGENRGESTLPHVL